MPPASDTSSREVIEAEGRNAALRLGLREPSAVHRTRPSAGTLGKAAAPDPATAAIGDWARASSRQMLRCFRCVEIERLDAVRLYVPDAVRKDLDQALFDGGCQQQMGSHEMMDVGRAGHEPKQRQKAQRGVAAIVS